MQVFHMGYWLFVDTTWDLILENRLFLKELKMYTAGVMPSIDDIAYHCGDDN